MSSSVDEKVETSFSWVTSLAISSGWHVSQVAVPRNVLHSKMFSTVRAAMAKKYVNHFKFTTLLEYKFGATRNYWIIKNKSSQIQWMSTEYNKSHTRHFEEKWKKIQHCIILYCFFGEDISKTRASGLIRFPNARKHLKPRGLRPRGFKSILAPFRAAIHVCLTFAQIKQIKKVWARVKR